MANLQLIIDAVNNASKAIDDTKKSIGELADTVDEVGTNSTEAEQPTKDFGDVITSALGTAAVIAVGVKAVAEGITMVMDAARNAAELNVATMQFDNLVTSIGEYSDAVMIDMRAASKQQISDAELQAGAAMLISSGYAKSSEDLSRFAAIAVGMDVPFEKVSKLVGGAANGLKNYGVDISGVKDRVDELVKLDYEKSTAQMMANTEALEQHIKTRGSVADTELGLYKQLDAAKANSVAKTDEETAAFGRFFAQTALSAHGLYQQELAYEDLRSQLVKNNIDFKEEAEIYNSFASSSAQKTQALEDMAVKLYGAEYALGRFSSAELAMIDTVASATSNYDEFISAAHRSGISVDGITEAIYNEVMAVNDLNNAPLEDKEVAVTAEGIDDAEAELKKLDEMDLKDKSLNVDVSVSGAGAGLVTGGGGGGGGGGAMYEAVGGAVYGGNPYTWQEYGYKGELFVPSSNGFVMSRADAERALAKALTGGGVAADPDAIGRAVAKALSGVTKGNQSGNVYNLTMPTSSNPADVRTAFELMEAWA